jgi:hypothetical protein
MRIQLLFKCIFDSPECSGEPMRTRTWGAPEYSDVYWQTSANLDKLTDATCVGSIRVGAIDTFNACANNGYDIVSGELIPPSCDITLDWLFFASKITIALVSLPLLGTTCTLSVGGVSSACSTTAVDYYPAPTFGQTYTATVEAKDDSSAVVCRSEFSETWTECGSGLTVTKAPLGRLAAVLVSPPSSSKCAYYITKWNGGTVLSPELVSTNFVSCGGTAIIKSSLASMIPSSAHSVMIVRYPDESTFADIATASIVCGRRSAEISFPVCSSAMGYISTVSISPSLGISITRLAGQDLSAYTCKFHAESWGAVDNSNLAVPPVKSVPSCAASSSVTAADLGSSIVASVTYQFELEVYNGANSLVCFAALQTAGFTLTVLTEPDTDCTQAEWDKIRSARIVSDMIALLLRKGDSETSGEVLDRFTPLMTSLKAFNPSLTFPCDTCLSALVTTLAAVSAASIQSCLRSHTVCESTAGTPIYTALQTFKSCSGFALPLRYSLPCSLEEFLTVDAEQGAYEALMVQGLTGSSLSRSFQDVYTRLSCRECFDEFHRTIVANRAILATGADSSAGPCGSVSTIYSRGTGSANCIDETSPATIVNGALVSFTNCAGAGKALWTKRRNTAVMADRVLLNDGMRIYEAAVECAVMGGGGPTTTFGSPSAEWKSCLVSRSPVYAKVDNTALYCYQVLGSVANGIGQACTDAFDATPSTGCKTILSANSSSTQFDSPLVDFYHCSGFEIDSHPTQCSAAQFARIAPMFKSFVPMLEHAIAAKDPSAAVKRVLSGFIGTENIPCRSCYAKLAAELHVTLSEQMKKVCTDPYGDMCSKSVVVGEALRRFETCSGGFRLSSSSPYTSTADEWETLTATTEVERKVMDLIVVSKQQNLFSALLEWIHFQKSFTISNPTTNSIKCFQDLIIDFDPVPSKIVEKCDIDIESSECVAGGANSPLRKFAKCSGHEFQPAKSSGIETEARVSVMDDSFPEISKSSSNKYAGILILAVVVLVNV